MESLGPLTGLGKVARGEMSREAYLEAYGHRGVNENEYAWPRPLEDPAWLDRQLAEFAEAPVDIDALLAKQQAAFAAAWERFRARYPRKAKSMRLRLEQAAQAARQREAVRSEATRSAMAIRAFALRAGELTGVGEDVFFLTIYEVLVTPCGRRLGPPVHPPAQGDLRALPRPSALPDDHRRPIRSLPVGGGPKPAQRHLRSRMRAPSSGDAAPAGASHHEDTTDIIKGFAGALGIVEGTVRRLDRLEDSDQLQPGEILVTTMTNIGWTPLFPRVAAIVTDLGAPLSHAAIVARELGIPAVVGCGDATMRLKTGDRVRVDGGQGLVEILESGGVP